jgi:hypothetical protein
MADVRPELCLGFRAFLTVTGPTTGWVLFFTARAKTLVRNVWHSKGPIMTQGRPLKGSTYPRIIGLLVIFAIACWALWLSFGRSDHGKEIRNVLIISIDTCRADFLSCYHFPLHTTPNLDDLAADGVVFEKAITPHPFTLPAHCSMLTGTISPHHGVLDNGLYTLSADQITLAEILRQH